MDSQKEIDKFNKALKETLDSHYTKEQQEQMYQDMKAKNDKEEPIWITKMLKSMLDDGVDPEHVLDLLYNYSGKITDEQYQEVQEMAVGYLADTDEDIDEDDLE